MSAKKSEPDDTKGLIELIDHSEHRQATGELRDQPELHQVLGEDVREELAGIALALHFAAWITSLRLTSVAASAVLVSLSPVFAWGFSLLFLGEPWVRAPRKLGDVQTETL